VNTSLRPVAVNLAGSAESPSIGSTPFRVDIDGHPYVPVGDGGIVLGVELGQSVSALDGDHVAAGVTIAHPDPAANFALTAYSCIGNPVRVTSGDAQGTLGVVIGKRGEAGRVIVSLPPSALARLQPGDGMSIRAFGQGSTIDGAPTVDFLNIDPGLVGPLGFAAEDGVVRVTVAGVIGSRLAGNGVGRPAQMWDVDLAFPAGDPLLGQLRLGDLVAVHDLDVRHNIGYRRGWVTIGVIVHGDSPQPGHGPGLTPLATGPIESFHIEVSRGDRAALDYALDVFRPDGR
jgi:Domain of unknown function (DUF4438)